LAFLEAHHYWTDSAHALYDAQKVLTEQEIRRALDASLP